MPTVPDAPVAGVLYSTASIQKLVTAIIELQGAGILATSSAATTTTTGGPTAITPWALPFTLTQSRKIQLVQNGLMGSSAGTSLGATTVSVGGITFVTEVYFPAASGDTQDINRASLVAVLTAGSYTVTANLSHAGTASTITLSGTATLMVLDLGPA